MKDVVRKTTFDKDLTEKELYFLSLTPNERLEIAADLKKRMFWDKPSVTRSEPLKVNVRKPI